MPGTLRRRLVGSARARILLSTILLLAFATLGSTLVLRQILNSQARERIDAALVQEVDEFRRLVREGRDPRNGQPFGSDLEAIFDVYLRRNVPAPGESFLTFVGDEPYLISSDRPQRRRQAEALEDLSEVTRSERGVRGTPVGDVRYLAVPIRAGNARGTFVVTFLESSEREQAQEATQAAATVSLVMLVLASGLAFLLAGRVLAPLRTLSETATSITETDLSRRIDVRGHDEIAELARTFNAMLDRIEGGFRTQRDFISDAGHELRTPITIIRGHLELLAHDPADAPETIPVVVDELDRMSRFVDDLLLLARAEHGAGFLLMSAIDIDELTDELLVKARALGERQWERDAIAIGQVRADRQRLTQAVMNLARNAVEHTAPGDTIALGTQLDGDELRLWVRDTGPGVPLAEQTRIFDRFTRGRGGRRRSEGAGLGLSIVRALAEAHHGRVELTSKPGEGATFSVVVPVSPPDQEVPR